jgi:hypothetical protein
MATYLSDAVNNFGAASASTISPSAAYTRTAGSCAVAIVGWFTGDGACTVDDTSGQTWVSVTGSRLSYPAQSMWLEMFYAKNVTGSGSTTVTAHFAAASEYRSIIVFGLSGLSTGTVLGSFDTEVVSSTNAPAMSPDLTVDGAGATVVGIAAYNSVATWTPQNGLNDSSGGALNYLNASYKVQASGGSQAIAYSSSSTTTFLIIAASLLDTAGGGGGGVPKSTRLTMLGIG